MTTEQTNKMTTEQTNEMTYKYFFHLHEKADRELLNVRFSQLFWAGEDDFDIKKQFFHQADIEVAREIIKNCEKIIELGYEEYNSRLYCDRLELVGCSINNESRIQELFDSHKMMPLLILNPKEDTILEVCCKAK